MFFTNSYTELQSGLGIPDPTTGRYHESSPNFSILANGYAVATNCAAPVMVGPNLNDASGLITLQMPDGAGTIRASILGLNLFDSASGKSLQVSSVKNCAGVQTAPNEITFFDAFQGLRADVRIRNERARFHQEVLLKEQLTPDQLAKLGFPDSTYLKLEAWTEFFVNQQPTVQPVTLYSQASPDVAMAEPDVVDDAISFPTLSFGQGLAFAAPGDGESVGVFKQWMQTSGRTVLVESVNYPELVPLLANLPASTIASYTGKSSSKTLLVKRTPLQRAEPSKEKGFQIARLDPAKVRPKTPEVVWDYVTLNLLPRTRTHFRPTAPTCSQMRLRPTRS
jgi:hypothetical protein